MSEERDGRTFAVGLLIGALVGAGVALLVAPHSGEETRRLIRRKAKRIASEARDKFDDVKERVRAARRKAEEAISFYTSVFSNAPNGGEAGETKATVLARYGKGEDPDTEGAVRYAHFSLLGQEFGAIDSGREHKFASNEAI